MSFSSPSQSNHIRSLTSTSNYLIYGHISELSPTGSLLHGHPRFYHSSREMAPTFQQVGTELLRQIMEEGKKRKRSRSMSAKYMNAKAGNFYLLFNWAEIEGNSLAYGLIVVFIFSVVATIVVYLLRQFESEVLGRRQNETSLRLRLGAATAFTVRMAFMYIMVSLVLSTLNIWVLLCLLGGHFVGWVIYSSMEQQFNDRKMQDPVSRPKCSFEKKKSMDESTDSTCSV